MSRHDNKAVVTEFLGRFSANDLQGVLDMMSVDSTWWIGGKTEIFPLAGRRTKQEMKQVFHDIIGSMPNGVEMRVRSLIAEEDRVAAEVESYGPTANGKIYNNEYHFLFRLRDGEILEVKEYLDTMHVADVFLSGSDGLYQVSLIRTHGPSDACQGT